MSTREFKGSSLLDLVDDYVVIDLETTGLSPRHDHIIEIAALRIRNGMIADSYSSLINPEQELDPFITELTGITNEDLQDAPLIDTILPEALNFIGSDIVIAHNAHFDVNFLYDYNTLLNEQPFKNDFVDTMRISRNCYKEEQHHRLIDLATRFGITDEVEHRALADCILTHQCYEMMKVHIRENNVDLRPASFFSLRAKDVTTDGSKIDETSPVFGQNFVFTGTLDRMSRKEAIQIVTDIGGICQDQVTKETNFLVLGNLDYCSTIKNGKSSKQKKAEKLILEGQNLSVISENVFFDMVKEYLIKENDTREEPKQQPELTSLEQRIIQLTKEVLPLEAAAHFRYEKKKGYLIGRCFYPLFVFKTLKGRLYFTAKELPEGFDLDALELDIALATKADGGKERIFLDDLETDFQKIKEIIRFSYHHMDNFIKEHSGHHYKGFKKDFQNYLNDLSLFTVEDNVAVKKETAPVVSCTFDACSRYLECSDQKQCVHPDPVHALECGYKRKLDQGIIFYGKNRNID